jgi:hypothetical protein
MSSFVARFSPFFFKYVPKNPPNYEPILTSTNIAPVSIIPIAFPPELLR